MAQTARAFAPLTLAVSDQDPVFQRVCQLLAPFNRHGINLQRDTDIVADVEVDSVAIFDVVMEVEDSYDVTFPMETISDIKTIGDLVDTIHSVKKG